MSKRTWSDANTTSPHAIQPFPSIQAHGITSPSQSILSQQSSSHPLSPKRFRPEVLDQDVKPILPKTGHVRTLSTIQSESQRLPGISRKVKACAACRKQKIKCIMVGDPPCQRCKERGLSCKLNKSLQTLMSEDSRWKASVTRDVTGIYGSLEKVLKLLNLPELPSLQLSAQDPAMFFEIEADNAGDDDDELSADNSPKVTPITDTMSHVPIESLYQITGLKSLKRSESMSEDQSRICKQLRDTDFIARGIIKPEDAEYLVDFYLKRLDPYIWHLAGEFADLEAFRSRSPTLTACVLTIAALHDVGRSSLYPVCAKEYKRLVANAMFERKIDMDYLRACVIGSYWLSDISWTLSGYAIRRASEFQFKQCYQIIVDSQKPGASTDQKKLQEAMSGIRMLYLLYVADHHQSILYGRSSIMRDNETYITGWEKYLSCPLAVTADRRIAGQICLLYTLNQIRETLGPEDTYAPLPESALSQIARFEEQLDDWVSRFSRHNHHPTIGTWPNKGAVMHYHWAKLYLTSYVLRGLNDHRPVIPDSFRETAQSAVASATGIITFLLEDKDAHFAITYVPHHVHGMIAFATMFLLKAATRHAEQLNIDRGYVSMLMAALSKQFKATVVGKDHLIHRMAEGVEKMAEMLDPASRNRTPRAPLTGEERPDVSRVNSDLVSAAIGNGNGNEVFDPIETFDFNDPAMGLGMPFFDFEGTTLAPGDTMWTFQT